MRWTFELGGWALAIGALLVASVARYRTMSLAEAVARMCHELRGPITAARLGLTLAFRSGEPPDGRLKAIELELSRAALALDDLARVPAGGRAWGLAHLGGELVELAPLLTDAVEVWRGPAVAHGAALRLRASAGSPTVRGHRLRLAQAICNLIANAVEHGGGVVEVGWRAGGGKVVIEVWDQGPGLPAPVRELARRPRAVWRPWRRRGRRCRPGSRRGHGLAVATAIALAHGGLLTAGPSDRGARLMLELPLAREAAAD